MKERLPPASSPDPASRLGQSVAKTPKLRRGRWAIILGLLIFGGAFHAALLRLAVRPLIADDERRAADLLFVYSGDGRFDRAVEAYRSGEVRQLLVLERPPTRLVRMGILPSRADECRRELARRGVPEEAIVLIPGAANTPWQTAHCLNAWLQDHPRLDVEVLCDRFASGDLQYVMTHVLGAEKGRVGIQALPDRRYDEASWWRSRAGWRAALGAACELSYDRLLGEDRDLGPSRDFDPAAFERALR